MKREEFLAQILHMGVNVPDALARFMGNQQLYLSFLCRFPQAMDLEGIRQALQTRQEESFYKKVHDLKGLAGNLSITPVANLAETTQEVYQKNGFSRAEELAALLDRLEQAAAPLTAIIEEYNAQGGME